MGILVGMVFTHSVMALISSPCGSQSASQSVASKHPCRVSSASCDHLFTVLLVTGCLWMVGLYVEERKTRFWPALHRAGRAELYVTLS